MLMVSKQISSVSDFSKQRVLLKPHQHVVGVGAIAHSRPCSRVSRSSFSLFVVGYLKLLGCPDVLLVFARLLSSPCHDRLQMNVHIVNSSTVIIIPCSFLDSRVAGGQFSANAIFELVWITFGKLFRIHFVRLFGCVYTQTVAAIFLDNACSGQHHVEEALPKARSF